MLLPLEVHSNIFEIKDPIARCQTATNKILSERKSYRIYILFLSGFYNIAGLASQIARAQTAPRFIPMSNESLRQVGQLPASIC